MAKDLLNRYIWIVDTIRRYGRISRRELNELWSRSPYAEGELEIPRRTFFNYRQAIEDLFAIRIGCDTSTYEYYVEGRESQTLTDWLLNASVTSSVLKNSQDIADRIMIEDVPSARQHLATVMEAIRESHPVRFNYHPYTRSNPSTGVVVEPYFLRIYRQLWYMTGRCVADDKVKTYSLDRISDLTIMPDRFKAPEGTDPQTYFRNSFGIVVDQSAPHRVVLKTEVRQAKYFRALPLHPSQSEMITDAYSIFTLELQLTPDFVAQLLSYGPSVEVVTPRELRSMVVSSLRKTLAAYNAGGENSEGV